MKPSAITATTALALATTATLCAAASPAATSTPRPPNIILFLVDDMGYGDIAPYGNYAINTPHLTRAAAEGLRIEHFYVAYPICSPSRTALTTGQYPQRWGITSYLDNASMNAQRGMPNWLDPKAPTLARILQQAGYATGHFGKWHMGGQRDVGDAPLITEYGFDDSATNFEGLGDRYLPVFSRRMAAKNKNMPDGRYDLGSAKLGRGNIEWAPRWEVTSRFIDRAIDFIEKARRDGKPFYINLWPDDPHTPVEPSPPYRGDYSQRARYQGVVRELDRDFGRLLNHIRNDPGLADNTIVIFSSDNGPEKDVGSSGNLRGYKTQLYEGGIREPFIIWAPRLLTPACIGKANTTSDFSAIDLAPTLLSIAGVRTPAGVKFDGHNMADVFLGRSNAPHRPAPLFFSRPPDRPGAKNELPDFAVRDGKWKFYLHADGKVELYDLADDPGEMLDKAADNPQLIKELTAKLAAWQKDVGQETIFPATEAAKRYYSPRD
jgi:uncharacterized sulfatase